MKLEPESSGAEVFDPRGDLTLVAGEDRVALRVCSRSLARSSPVWDVMLYGPFAEGRQQQQEGCGWEIPLPDDRPEGLRILFSVAHGKFDDLPRAIAHDELLSLVVLADKYDMIGLLKPFWKNWLKDPNHVADCAADELVDHLSVYHKMGHVRGFRKAFVSFITRAATSDNDGLYIDGFPDYDIYTDNHLWLLDDLGTISSLDHGSLRLQVISTDGNPNAEAVKRGRQKLLQIICIKIKDAIESLLFRSRCVSENNTCDCAVLGALVKALASRKLDRWFSSRFEGAEDSITSCVSSFSTLLSEIRSETVVALDLSFTWGEDHRECSPWVWADERYGDEGMEVLDNLVLEYAAHLQERAKKSGLNPALYPN